MGTLLHLIAACAGPGALTVTVTDGRTGAPAPGVAVRLDAEGCAAGPHLTDEDGELSVAQGCGDARVAVADPGWTAAPVTASGGRAAITAWQAPEADGVYLLDGRTLTPLLTNTAVDTLPLLGGAGQVRLPVEIPGALPELEGSRVLLLAGTATAALQWLPLVPGGARTFGPPEAPVPVDPWVYLGVRFREDGGTEPVDAGLDAARVVATEVSGRPLRYVPADALPAGRYALAAPDAIRALLVEVGAPVAAR